MKQIHLGWSWLGKKKKMPSEYSICKQQGKIMSEREHCLCIEPRDAAGWNRKLPLLTAGSSHGAAHHTAGSEWEQEKDKEVERTKNARDENLEKGIVIAVGSLNVNHKWD